MKNPEQKKQPFDPIAIRTIEKEIYENINQCLCLVRLQLGTIDLENKERSRATISESVLLIGKVVRDLRNLAKQLTYL